MQNTLIIVDRLNYSQDFWIFIRCSQNSNNILSSDEIDLFSPLGAKNDCNDTNQPPLPFLLIPLNCSGTQRKSTMKCIITF